MAGAAAVGLTTWILETPNTLEDGLLLGVVFGLAPVLALTLASRTAHPGEDRTSPADPLSSWRADRNYGLVGGCVVGVTVGLVGVLTGYIG